jgi:hypothetical protein
MNNKKAAHFVWLNPGEKLYVISDAVGHNHDYTNVVEISLPWNRDESYPMYDPNFSVTAKVIRKYEMNEIANMTTDVSENEHTVPVDAVVAKDITAWHGGGEPFVTVTLASLKKEYAKNDAQRAAELLEAFGAEDANDPR